MTGISKSQVSRLCAEIDERVKAFLHRPIEGDWPYLGSDGPREALIRTIRRGKKTDGLKLLAEHDRLDCSYEQIAVSCYYGLQHSID